MYDYYLAKAAIAERLHDAENRRLVAAQRVPKRMQWRSLLSKRRRARPNPQPEARVATIG